MLKTDCGYGEKLILKNLEIERNTDNKIDREREKLIYDIAKKNRQRKRGIIR